jgi:phenylalanyl-tRNA synthetase beta chain
MIVNTKWLSQYTEIPFNAKELAEKLTYLGLESTLISNRVNDISDVIIAQIEEIFPHPHADRLNICRIFTGSERLEIVCGAPNIDVGQKVPLARIGTTLPNGMSLKPVKIRGVASAGMLCAEDELGLSDDHSGIMILGADAPLGVELKEYLGNKGASIDIDLTPNRPDCASHIGVAREITLLTGGKLNIPEIEIKESDAAIQNYIDIEIVNKVGCPRYAARVVRGVKIGPSPGWLVDYLTSVGLRSINNVVDAANFVLLETGHPLHTFDYHRIEGKKIVVRSARDGEEVVTLDGIKRELSSDVLLICDASKPVAIAGIMGLENSEITSTTTDILIESAYFDPVTIRKGSKKLGLQTEASYRFERGADPEGAIYALNRLADLIAQLASGSVCKGIVDCYPRALHQPEITVRFQRVNAVLGTVIDPDWIVEKFNQLGCQIITCSDQSVTLKVPSWRPDLEREVDLIEEIVRIYGMHLIPDAGVIRIQPGVESTGDFDLVEKLRLMLATYGLFEVMNNSLVNEEQTRFGIQNYKAIKIKNPLNQELAYLRTSLIPGLLQTVKYNISRQNFDLPLFELGFVQHYNQSAETHADEYQKFAVLLTGFIEDRYWGYERRQADIYILKGIIQEICNAFGIKEVEFKVAEHEHFENLMIVQVHDRQLAYLGKLGYNYLQKLGDIEIPVFVLEGDIITLKKFMTPHPPYHEIPIYPGIQRDISLLVSSRVKVGEIEQLIRENGGEYLREVIFYDLYQGKNIDKGQKSVTFNLVFQAEDRTLQDMEIEQRMKIIYQTLQSQLDAKLR